MTSVFRLLFMGSLLVPCAAAAVAAASEPSPSCQTIIEQVQPGDLIFLAIDDFLYRRVARATLTWTSHVGIVLPDTDGRLKVYESAVPLSRTSDICSFIGRTADDKLAILRLKENPPSPEEVQRMVLTARAHLNRLYNFSFDYDGWGEYCSKFVREVYLSGMGVSVGEVKTVRELIDANPDKSLLTFWKYWFLGKIPYAQRIVTPASQLNDPKFVPIFSSPPPI
jgi:hypothetical protein